MRLLLSMCMLAVLATPVAHAAPSLPDIHATARLVTSGRGVLAWPPVVDAVITCVARNAEAETECVVAGGRLRLTMVAGDTFVVTAYAGGRAIAQGSAVARYYVYLPITRSAP